MIMDLIEVAWPLWLVCVLFAGGLFLYNLRRYHQMAPRVGTTVTEDQISEVAEKTLGLAAITVIFVVFSAIAWVRYLAR